MMNHDEALHDWAETYLSALISATLDDADAAVDFHQPFAEMGIDSFRVLKIIKKLEDDFGALPKTLLFEHVNLAELTAFLAQNYATVIAARLGREAPPAVTSAAAPVAETVPAAPVATPVVAPAETAPVAVVAAKPAPAPVSITAGAPLRMLERDAYADPALRAMLEPIFDQYKNEAGASRGARSIAPNIFVGSARRGFFNYARCKNILLAYAYTGPDDYFAPLAEELLDHCRANKLQLNLFADRVLGTVGTTRFSSTPFGALQRVTGLADFALEGGPMRRLRYQVSKFQKAGDARTVEYRLGADAEVERAIAGMIDTWCSGKPMVNPLIHQVKQEILARTLDPKHRLFLTYLDDVLQNVILISPLGPDFGGYLMDLEFYGAAMPLGGLDFGVVSIMEQLKAEGADMLSLGGTYGCRLVSCDDADPEIDRILDQLHAQKIFNDDGNLQFKNKFRPENRTIYLCRAADAGKADNIIDLIMMIADPYAMQTADTEQHAAPELVPTAPLASAPAPAAAAVVPTMAMPPAAAPTGKGEGKLSPTLLKEIGERRAALAKVGFNPNNLAPEQVPFDLKTDSWAQLHHPVIASQVSHLRSQLQMPADLDEGLKAIFPFAHFTLTSSGRNAEEIFYKAQQKKGLTLQNVLFPTGLFHQIDNGFDPVELPCAPALQVSSDELFQGDLAWEALAQRVAADPKAVAMVVIELSNNAVGGLPVSMRQLRQLKPLLAEHAIPLVIDGTRVLENAQFLIENEPEFAGQTMWTVTRELLGHADAVICSLAKDFGINCGGLVATNDAALAERLEQLAVERGNGIDAIGRKLVARALHDRKRIETMVLRRMESVKRLWTACRERDIPVAQPAGGHCILFDVKRMPAFATLAHPVASFVAWFYLNTGIRVGAHSVGMQKGSVMNDMVRLTVPLGLKSVQIDQIVRRVLDLFARMDDVPDLMVPGGGPARLADVHARFTLRAPAPAEVAAPPVAHEAGVTPVGAPVIAPAVVPAAVPVAAAVAVAAPEIAAPVAAAPATPAVSVPSATASVIDAAANGAPAEPQRPAAYAVRDIAVIGMAGRYPNASNVNELWANLAQGIDCVSELPAERVAMRPSHAGAARYRGGFIADVDRFDSMFFNISPRDAELMDPQERLFLEVAWEALEDAGYAPESLVPEDAPRNVGVFVGAVWAMYQMVGLEQRQAGNDTSPNSFLWSIANHVSYCLDLCGPSMAVDTACSSSLTALHLACEAIYKGECSAAIVGGVNLDLHPGKRDINQIGGALSADGVCRTFGKGANGYVAGEGVGAILVKPLEDAVRDGDAIYGVIKGIAVNHGGRAGGYAVPNPKSQSDVIAAALERAGIDARTLGYIEAHGTGTQLGDPIEIKGLSSAFGSRGFEAQSCAIGSVKTNIGHLEAAAGVVGVSKVLLQMRHGQLAPSLHSSDTNEFIDFEHSPFYVVQQLQPWMPRTLDGVAAPLRAGVSSFGAGGSNAHVILENHATAPVADDGRERVFPLSARSEEQLREVALRLRRHLQEPVADVGLASVAFTLQTGRKMFEYRAAIVASTMEQLIDRLGCLMDGVKDDSVFSGNTGSAAPLTKLLNRKEQRKFAQLLTAGRDLRRLAELWAGGMFADWHGTSAYSLAPRAHLPTYPFADRRHWVGRNVQAPQATLTTTAALHPMLDANESTFDRQIFKKSFNQRDFFIHDHHVSQIPTLPGVAYLEFARKAGELAAGRPVRRIRNILWLSPIAVHGAAAQDVMIELKPNAEVVHFEVYSLSAAQQRTVHAQGQLLYSGSDEAQPESIDLDAIRARCTRMLRGQDAYPQFNALGLGLGPSFQVLGDIHKNDGETLGRLQLSPARIADLEQLLLHPALLDGSLQAGAASQLDSKTAEMAVPYSIGEVEMLHPLQAQCWSYVRVLKDGKHANSRVQRADVLIVDDQGKVLVRLRETVGVPLTQVHKAAPEAAEDGDETLLYHFEWNEAALSDGAVSTNGTVLLLGADDTLAQRYRARVEAAGGDPRQMVLVRFGDSFAELDAGRYQVNPADVADYGLLFTALERHALRVAQVCVVGADAHQDLATSLERGVYALLPLCQTLALRQPQDALKLLYLFRSYDGHGAPQHEAINGFAGALQLEQPKMQFKTIELRDIVDDADGVVDIVLAEFADGADPARAIRYEGTRRLARRLKPADLAPADGAAALRERGVYLITGGAGGLGLIFAEHLARSCQARLVLTGRSPLSAKQSERLNEIAALGAEWMYVQADMSNAVEVERALAEARERFGAIHGVIHSAGVLRDSYLRNKSRSDMEAVLAPKVHGTVHLDALTRNDDLDLFVMFSSMSAVGGNPGQCDYCYANHFMDSFAARREQLRAAGERKGKTLSLNWSLWKSGGMQLDEQSERLLRMATGIRPLRSEVGLQAFTDALASNQAQVIVAEGTRATLERAWGLRPAVAKAAPAAASASDAASAPAGAANEQLAAVLRSEMAKIAMDFLKLDAADLRTDQILLDMGFDSIGLATFANRVNEKFALDITPILFFDYPSIDDIARHLASERADDLAALTGGATATTAAATTGSDAPAISAAPTPGTGKNWNPAALDRQPSAPAAAPAAYSPATRFSDQPIAIVGMSGVMPQSDDLQAFWDNLSAGRNLVTEIPADRWRWEDHFGDPMKEQGKTNSKWGGFMNEVDKFDPLFFGISPREAVMMDPQQRIFLQTVWEAIEDSGHKVSDLAGTRTGLFVGAATNDYVNLVNRLDIPINAYTASGNSHSVLANRVSFLLNLRGPSAPIDTACSSSLIALHRAIESIHTGSCDMAIVGGVQVMLTPAAYVSFSMAGMLSDDGKCKTFDKRANGYVRGEGCGAILIKPLAKAEADGDHIYAVVKSTAENHGGKVTTLTAPNATAQAELLVEAYRKAQVDPGTVGYIECHGTGTSLGDPIEVQALGRAFAELYKQHGRAPAEQPHCGLSSVKTNIGHLETAAGIAGILKALLAIRHRQIPANAHFEELNPYINLKGTPFYIPNQTTDWQAPRDSEGKIQPRRAGVSSFGFGGANAHIVLEEYLPAPRASGNTAAAPRLIVLSAKNADRLQASAARLLAHVERHAPDLDSLAYTLQAGRDTFAERLAFVAADIGELRTKLAAFVAGDVAGVHRDHVRSGKHLQAGEAPRAVWSAQSTLDCVARGDFEQLAAQWVAGADIDWTQLYTGGLPPRVALPAYPFARERHWIDVSSAVPAAALSAPAAVLHPLVQRNTSTLQEQKFSTRLSGRESFLTDHVVESQKVLPGVAYMEMARAAGSLAAGAEVRHIRNLVWLTPLIVGEAGAEVDVTLTPKGEQVEFSVSGMADGRTVTHCRGQLGFAAGAPAPQQVDIEALRARCAEPVLDGASLYAYFASMGLQLGNSFQVVQRIWANQDEALAQLQLPASVAEEVDRFMLHPALMDGALHTAIGLMKKGDIYPPLSLPFAVGEVEIHGSMRDVHYGYATWSETDRQADPSHWKANFLFLDREGRILVRIKEFASRPRQQGQSIAVRAPNVAVPAASTSSLHALLPVWHVAPAAPAVDLNANVRVLLAGGSPAQLAWLRAACPQSQVLELDADAAQLAAQLRDGVFDELMWVAPEPGPDDAGDALIAGQERGVLALFRLTKALLDAGYGGRELRWTMVTVNAQQVRAADRVQPAHASVLGYAGSLAREYPHWRLRLLDVESLQNATAKECLTAPWATGGKGRAHRGGEWFVQQLAVAHDLAAPAPAYRQGGVYVIVGGAGGIGAVFSRHLIERYQARIVWIGRRASDASIEAAIAELATLGTAPLYIQADAADAGALAAAQARILSVYPAIHGVVHSALVLRDQSIAMMNEEAFQASLSAKVDTSVNIDRVFGGADLDFMLFFSSILSFNSSPGQANYAAGCAFKDAFARSLQAHRAYPVKTMNWGFWGKVGVVADPVYLRNMAQMGIGSIEPEEGMAQLELLVGLPLAQMALLKTEGERALAGIESLDQLRHHPRLAAADLAAIEATVGAQASAAQIDALKQELPSPEQEAIVAEILTATLSGAGLLPAAGNTLPTAHHELWLQGSARYLQKQGWLDAAGAQCRAPRALPALWDAWSELRAGWIAARPHHSAQTTLIENCLRALPDILAGKQPATDVLFPRSSMQLVEGVYRGNPLADHFNQALGQTLASCIAQWLARDSGRKIRILEIGAGTGATTAALLPVLQGFGDSIAEYCYTDVSKAFLMHAARNYQPQYPAMTTALFDVGRPLAGQAVQPGRYDIVLAANVLHATPDIRATLRNAKATMTGNGVLLLNEIGSWSLFSHLTFGLLEGWWAFADPALRMADCPGIDSATWKSVLTEEGFPDVRFPARTAHALGQQIIAAASDGVARQIAVDRPAAAPQAIPVANAPARRDTTPIQREVKHNMGREHIRKLVADKLSDALQLDAGKIRHDEPFADYGVDSIVGVNLVRTISEALQIELETTSLFEYSTVNDLADYIHATWGAQLNQRAVPADAAPTAPAATPQSAFVSTRFAFGAEPVAAAKTASTEPAADTTQEAIAIIGMSGRFAGSESLDAFWRNLRDGASLIKEVTRWDPERSVAGPATPGQYCRHGSFIDSVDLFDPAFFRISAQEADHMDPQQRLFLEESWKALEDAGYANKGMHERRCGVFVGCGGSKYDTLMGDDSPAMAFWGNSEAVVPARIAYHLDLQGPAIAVNTACSSSLVTIHLACQSLRAGETAMALAGGVFLQPTPGFHQVANRAGMLSTTGQCRSFDAAADGFVPGEGVGVVVLKRLSDALRDGDHVHGVIAGSGVNQDGASNGIIAPNAAAQERLEADVYERFAIEPTSIQLLEAHGTATLMGDSIEFGAVTRAFRRHTDSKQFCALGSVKENIGHAATAAGVAGVLKLLLALRHRQIPPSPGFTKPNPALDMDGSPFYVNRELTPWLADAGMPRRAAISGFGFSGTNAHMVIEEAPAAVRPAVTLPCYLVLVSARTPEQLRQQVENLRDWLQDVPDVSMCDLSYTLIVGRTHLAARLACVASDAAELAVQLQQWLDRGEAHDVFGTVAGAEAPRERPSLRKYGEFCLGQLAQSDADTVREHLGTIADLYAQGYALDYARVIPAGAAGRIPLPTYPFARERHWIAERADAAPAAVRAASMLHPLLHANTSDFGQISFSSAFRGDEAFLVEHAPAADQLPSTLLPAVAQLEMAREAVARATCWPLGAAMALQNVAWGAPVVVAGHTAVNVSLRESHDGVVDFMISSGSDAEAVMHCQGRALRDGSMPAPAVRDLSQLQERLGGSVADGDHVYMALAVLGLRTPEHQRAVLSVSRGAGELLAHLRLPANVGAAANRDEAEAYGLHPCLAEAALNVSLSLTASSAQPWLLSAGSLDSLRLLCHGTQELYAWVRQSEDDRDDGSATKLDIDFLDVGGRVCAELRGLSFHTDSRALAAGQQELESGVMAVGGAALTAQERVERFLQQAAAEELRMPAESVAVDISYFDLGFTSMGVTNLIRKTSAMLASELAPSLVFEYPTIRALAQRLAQSHAVEIAAAGGVAAVAVPGIAAGAPAMTAASSSTVLQQVALPDGGADLAGYEKLTF
jgi:acyl transferase domain-containing protein/tryptophanase/acyl carrier protein